MRCKYCNKEINDRNILKHEKSCKIVQTNKENIIDMYIGGKSIKNISIYYHIGKQKIIDILGDKKRNMSESAKLSHKLYPEKYKHSDESKNKMRISRLKYMKENPDKTAWRNKNMSYPEKCFLEKIKELKWDKKYQIVCEKSFYPFFIDFAFINEKIAIEIDGSQHLEDERKKSDEIKDKKLINDGWIVYRITAKKINEEIDIVFNDINKIIKNRYNYNGVLKTGIYKNEKFCECGKKISNNSRMCMTCSHKSQRKEKPPYKQLINEIKEYGYKGTGKKYGVSDNCIRKWKKKLEKWKNDK